MCAAWLHQCDLPKICIEGIFKCPTALRVAPLMADQASCIWGYLRAGFPHLWLLGFFLSCCEKSWRLIWVKPAVLHLVCWLWRASSSGQWSLENIWCISADCSRQEVTIWLFSKVVQSSWLHNIVDHYENKVCSPWPWMVSNPWNFIHDSCARKHKSWF